MCVTKDVFTRHEQYIKESFSRQGECLSQQQQIINSQREDFIGFQKKVLEALSEINHDGKNTRMGVQGVNVHLKELNGKVAEHAIQLNTLYNPKMRKAFCPNLSDIDYIRMNTVTIQMFKDYLSDERKRKKEEDLKQNRKIMLRISLIGLIAAVVMPVVVVVLTNMIIQ